MSWSYTDEELLDDLRAFVDETGEYPTGGGGPRSPGYGEAADVQSTVRIVGRGARRSRGPAVFDS